MIKTRQSETRPPENPDDGKKAFVCWNKDTQAQSLRVEMSGGGFFLFPYSHLTFAKMERMESREILTVSFTSHDLHIAGKNLRELGMALQKQSVDWIKEVSARYATLADGDAVFIEAIEVKEASEEVASGNPSGR